MESWRRCLEEYGLEPHRVDDVQVLSGSELKDFRQPVADVLALAQTEIDRLYRRLAGEDYLVLFTDTHGVAVDFRVAAALEGEARRKGLYLGSIWDEAAQGTNGVGTCLRTGRAVSVVQDEHFALQNTPLTCTAAPVHGPDGRMLAVLDIATPRSSDHARERLLLDIVQRCARRIENRLFRRTFGQAVVVRLSADPEFLDAAEECLVALDSQGKLIAADRQAPDMLGVPDMKALLGKGLDSVLGVPDTALLSAVGGKSVHLALPPGKRRLNAQAILPRREVPRRPPAAPRPAAAPDLATLAGADPKMRQAVAVATRLIDSDLPVLLSGETGTGKDVFARALHRASRRSSGPFVAVNCAAIPDSLIEGELFGYRPGAFTGAARGGSRGKLLEAAGGTLFLDEIGDMPLAAQTRLLRVLSEHEVTPLGGVRPVPLDSAIVTATHRPLNRLVSEGGFRQDLYHRIAGAVLRLPPLRERADKMSLVAEILAEEASARPLRLDAEAAAWVERYHWPGNIRELRHVLRYATLLCDGDVITLSHLPDRLQGEQPPPADAGDPRRAQVLRVTLERCGWNVTMAARLLGVSRSTLHRQILAHNLRRSGLAEPAAN